MLGMLLRPIRRAARWASANKLRFAGFLLVLALVQGYAVRSALTSSTAVTRTDAIEEFHQAKAQAAEQQQAGELAANPGAVVTNPAIPTSNAPGTSKAKTANPAPMACDWTCPTTYSSPPEGAFLYYHCGRSTGQCTGANEPQANESVAGVERPIPRQGYRIVTRSSGSGWTNRHKYSDEHTEQFEMTIDQQGIFNHRYLVEMEFGGIPDQFDIRQVPGMQLARFPITLDDTWKGSWKDPNKTADGSYTARIVGKEELNIGGKTVRTWKITATTELFGPRTFGRADLTLWYFAEKNLIVQEYYDQDVHDNTNVGFKGKWMATLASFNTQN